MRRCLAVTLAALLLTTPAWVSAGPTASHRTLTQRRTAQLVQAIKRQHLNTVKFKDATLKEVVDWLRIVTAKNYVIKYTALAKADVDLESIRYTFTLSNVKLTSFLSMILKPHDMAAVVKGNVIYITSKADSYGRLLTRMYSIAHITYTKTDFIAPQIHLNPSGFVEEEYEPEVVRDDDPLAEGEAVADLIKQMVLPKGWEANDNWNISATKTYLVVRAPKAVHARMSRALAMISSMK